MTPKKTMLILPGKKLDLLGKFLTQGLGAVTEYKFHPDRRWRFDYAWPDKKIAVEQEGAIWAYGRHNHPTGMIKDMEKYNAAAELGWRILRYQPKKFDLEQIRRVVQPPQPHHDCATAKKTVTSTLTMGEGEKGLKTGLSTPQRREL